MQTMMTNPAYFTSLSLNSDTFFCVDLPAIAGARLQQLPLVLRLLLENVVRTMRGDEREHAITALLAWLETGSSSSEIEFQPGRVLMHDTTSTPALVDIAAMRNVLAELGADPALLNPGIPVDVSVDHSLAVEVYAVRDAIKINLEHELRRNQERYRFLRWAATVLEGVRLHPPGTGIMHTINLEQLASVVTTEIRDGQRWAVPDMMIGTDSHTPMINGIGVLGWGVGGLEAQTVMFGMPTMLRIPDVIGVKLVGQLGSGVLATDLALTVTKRLRDVGVTGEFVEFFGPGVSTLAAGERAVVANMAPEYGATTGYFGIDDNTLAYLEETGRTPASIALVKAYAKRCGLWFDPQITSRYTRTIEIDLSVIGMQIAGPRRPQDLLHFSQSGMAIQASNCIVSKPTASLPAFPVAIAAISSCTNTSDPGLLIAAGLLARKARALGLQIPAWVKTSLAPGSPAAASYLARAGLLEDLEALGFGIVGYGCTTCIGNPGPLTDIIREAQEAEQCKGVAIVSGNRNFPGRVHPDIELSFIMSPMLVIGFALAGDTQVDLERNPLQRTASGREVFLKELVPSREEIARCVQLGTNKQDYFRDFARASANPMWHALKAPESQLYPWQASSTILRRPPFAVANTASSLGKFEAFPLLILGDDVTTDHISPASAIPKASFVADYLVAQGDSRHDLNVFASRRGNWEVMMRAAFYSKTLANALNLEGKTGYTLHIPSTESLPIWEVATRYANQGQAVVIVAGERLLGVRAVLAVSFERIHRSNLIGMGILPLNLPDGLTPETLKLEVGDSIEIDAPESHFSPRSEVRCSVKRRGENVQVFSARAAVETLLEVKLLREGGVIPSILRKTLREQELA
jgi:aconitate hydratase